MGLKILHSADWHLDSGFTAFGTDQRKQLRQAQRGISAAMAGLVKEHRCDLVLLAGDLFDAEPAQRTVEAFKSALAEMAVPVFISPGNHDYVSLTSPWVREAWPENVHIFKGGMESVALPELDARVWGGGYSAMDCPSLLEGFQARGQEKWQLGVLHGDPLGADSPYCPVTAAQVRASGLDYLALGHIHKAGSFQAGDTLCGWPGCPMGRGWDETGEKGFYLVELEEKPSLRWLPFPGRRFYDETLELTGDGEAALAAILPGALSGDFYRITLTGEAAVDVDGLRERFSHIPNLVLRDRTQPPLELWANMGADSLEGLLFQKLYAVSEASQGREREQALLAAQLCRRLIAGREVELP